MVEQGAGYVVLDPDVCEARRLECGLSVKRLLDAGIRGSTWKRIVKGEKIWVSSAKTFAKLVGEKSLLPLLCAAEKARLMKSFASGEAIPGLVEWQADTLLGNVSASNDLQYQLWKLKHRYEENRWARGKRYDVHLIPSDQQQGMLEFFVRHGKICNRLRGHPRFPDHLTTIPESKENVWWVLDEWTPGATLAEVLLGGPLGRDRLPRVMREIAEGLQALHGEKIIRRELSPRFIILKEPGDEVVLTDFELGKLLDGSPTVAGDWPPDPYRALDVGGKFLTEEDMHVDLYSWARILVHAATGGLPIPGDEARFLESSRVPPKVREIANRCLAPANQRPRSIEEVIKAMRGWK